MTTTSLVVLAVTSLGAATVNGALGYGYSSISVPVALLVVAGRVLNPAIVIVEVALNLYALFLLRRDARRVLPRVLPLALGLVPGVIAGAVLLDHVAPRDVKLAVFVVLLPLVLVQATGRRWPFAAKRRAALPAGAGIGLLYGVTTISGPPLAMYWNNQGLAKADFKVALALSRTIESLCALAAYAYLGLFADGSAALLPWIVPGVVLGFPLGHRLLRDVRVESFRRACASFDVYLISFGLARTLADAGVAPALAYQVVVASALVDGWLLYHYVRAPRLPRAIAFEAVS